MFLGGDKTSEPITSIIELLKTNPSRFDIIGFDLDSGFNYFKMLEYQDYTKVTLVDTVTSIHIGLNIGRYNVKSVRIVGRDSFDLTRHEQRQLTKAINTWLTNKIRTRHINNSNNKNANRKSWAGKYVKR